MVYEFDANPAACAMQKINAIQPHAEGRNVVVASPVRKAQLPALRIPPTVPPRTRPDAMEIFAAGMKSPNAAPTVAQMAEPIPALLSRLVTRLDLSPFEKREKNSRKPSVR